MLELCTESLNAAWYIHRASDRERDFNDDEMPESEKVLLGDWDEFNQVIDCLAVEEFTSAELDAFSAEAQKLATRGRNFYTNQKKLSKDGKA